MHSEQEIFKTRYINLLVSTSEKRSKKNGFDFDITAEYIHKLWNANNGRCSLTDIEFTLIETNDGDRQPFTPSIDRINRRKGYVKGNVRLVCVAVNMALFTWGDEVFNKVVESRWKKLNPDKEKTEIDNIMLSLSKKLNKKRFNYEAIKRYLEKDITLLNRDNIEFIFNLKRGWIKEREKNKLATPPHATCKENKNGIYTKKYDLMTVFNWFADNKQLF